ncbi:Mce protein [Mycobacterium alsense]|uniref:Mce protein n=1 Tax=Mycobacterium alsense TaxID=324058 RepID=A0ABD6P935_9MYCO|nr:Mce protein [Mycobacterium alsense]OBG45593.1 Mce protein [Mycobacterium alsense]
MEGDAGAGRLNPPPMTRFRRLRRPLRKPRPKIDEPAAAAEETAAELTAEEAQEPTESEVEAKDDGDVEGDVEADVEAEVDETIPAETSEELAGPGVEDATEDAEAARRPSRLGRGWLSGIAAALVLLAGGLGAGGYLALRYHHQSQVIARNNEAALKAAVDCVSATQAPDTQAMAASEQKIIDCGTDAFRSQALLYTSMLVQAYQASNIHVQVSDVRAAVERNNDDGSIDVLVAMRVKVASDQQQNETGYRLRVKMAYAEGQYRISKLDQVTK